MKKVELVFVPFFGAGHLVSTVELAKLLVGRDDRLSVTVLVMRMQFESSNATANHADSFIASSTAFSNGIKFINLPVVEVDRKASPNFIKLLAQAQKPHVKEAVSELAAQWESIPEESRPRFGGFVLDMFCMEMIDVANEFGVPSYLFFTPGAACLGLMYYVQSLHDDQNVDPTEFKDSDAELSLPTLKNPLPAKVLPSVFLDKSWLTDFLGFIRGFKETKGVLVNTFEELESHGVCSLSNGETPPVYAVGPILNLKGDGHDGDNKYKEIIQWLDDQPPSSVVFLCFGSAGSLVEKQAKEIAIALERSDHRFLWSLRRPPPKDKMEYPSDYENLEEILPEGFLNRTAEIGKIIGWAPQVAVLAHEAVGGFVSHCGWNSTLESIWFGVPIATWPMYAEQQFNAFQLVVELGLAAEIRMDFRNDNAEEMIVSAEEIEKGLSCAMDKYSEMRRRVKEMSEKSRRAMTEGGSSHTSLGRFIQDVMNNTA